MNEREAADLAQMFPGRAAYNLEKTALGLVAERERLGLRPFVLIRSEQRLDIDGFADSAGIIDSFASLDLAVAAARTACTALRSQFALDRPIDPAQPCITETEVRTEGSLFSIALKLVRQPFERDDVLIEVFGPFDGGAISAAAIAHLTSLPPERAVQDPLGELLAVHFFTIGDEVARKRR